MPKRKQKKTHEEKIVEEFFPVEESDIRYAIEKIVKEQLEPEMIEKIGKKKRSYKRKYIRKKKSSNKKSKRADLDKTQEEKLIDDKKGGRVGMPYSPPKISLKPNGYELIITEKPQAALKIASALGTSKKQNISKIPYYEVERNGQKIIIACAVGHLFTLKQNQNGSLPIFEISWTPNYLVRKNDFSKKYYDALLKLAKGAGSLTIATDYDVEGELIGLNVVKFICNQPDANRMKFSTLTSAELNRAYENKNSSIDWGQAIAGETRHYLDWFYGINLSRALMNAIKSIGRFKIMSIGRVQGPALNLIVQKEREIMKFKPTPYWQIFITARQGKTQVELKHNKDISKKSELEKFKNLKGKTASAQTKKTQQNIPPLPPFNLTTLQTEAYKFHNITPSRTLQIAQSLYLAGTISYPRTSSQKLPDSINYKEILNKLAKKYNAENLIKRQKPIQGKKSDPAHPSIYPTGQTGAMNYDEEKIYNLIVKRFLALFCDNAIIDNKTIKVEIEVSSVREADNKFSSGGSSDFAREKKKNQRARSGDWGKTSLKGGRNNEPANEKLIFSTRGSEIKQKGWMQIYPAKITEKKIPDLNGEVEIIKTRTEQKMTQPPKRYSPASIVAELEKRNLGTKATRASILETLYDRDYITQRAIEATPFGISLITSLERYSPIIIDEALTRHFEKEMNAIQKSKKQQKEKQNKIINEAKQTITKIIKDMKKNENKIGKELVEANDEIIEQQRIDNTLNKCPKCEKGNLRILYNKNYKRYFIGCSNYPDCKTTYPLPPGLIKNANKICEHCGFPKLLRIQKGKRPWEFCFNPECDSRKDKQNSRE